MGPNVSVSVRVFVMGGPSGLFLAEGIEAYHFSRRSGLLFGGLGSGASRRRLFGFGLRKHGRLLLALDLVLAAELQSELHAGIDERGKRRKRHGERRRNFAARQR